MGRLSTFLAGLAIGSAILALFLAWYAPGQPGIFFLSSVALMLALLSSALSLLLASILFARKNPARPVKAVWLSLVSLLLAGGYLLLI